MLVCVWVELRNARLTLYFTKLTHCKRSKKRFVGYYFRGVNWRWKRLRRKLLPAWRERKASVQSTDADAFFSRRGSFWNFFSVVASAEFNTNFRLAFLLYFFVAFIRFFFHLLCEICQTHARTRQNSRLYSRYMAGRANTYKSCSNSVFIKIFVSFFARWFSWFLAGAEKLAFPRNVRSSWCLGVGSFRFFCIFFFFVGPILLSICNVWSVCSDNSRS